jgi:hypothetical protein
MIEAAQISAFLLGSALTSVLFMVIFVLASWDAE